MRTFCILIIFGLSGTANAGNLYKCIGGDGVSNYTSKKIAGSTCVVVAKTSPQQSKPSPAMAASVPVSAASVAATSDKTATTAPAPVPVTSAAPKQADAPKFLRMAQSTTYSYVDENGIKNFSSRRPKGASNVVAIKTEYAVFSQPTCYACAIPTSVSFGSLRLNTNAYASANVDPAHDRRGLEQRRLKG